MPLFCPIDILVMLLNIRDFYPERLKEQLRLLWSFREILRHGTTGEKREKRQVRRMYKATPAGQNALEAAKEKVKELFGELFEE
jgi:hypothetical protein